MCSPRHIIILFIANLAVTFCSAQNDIPARFPGGDNGYQQFMYDNLLYPESALESETDRSVKVIVIVDSIGKARIQEFVYEYSGLGFEEEVEGFIRKMPLWQPALYSNVPSTSQVILTFDFKFAHQQEGGEEIERYNLEFYEFSDVPPFYEFGGDSLLRRMQNILQDSLNLTVQNSGCLFEFLIDTLGRVLNLSVLENKGGISDKDWMYAFYKSGNWVSGLMEAKKVNVRLSYLTRFD